MKALEFEATLSADSKLKVPEKLAVQIPKEETVRVIVLLPENDDASDWERLTGEQFLSGYSESDSIYDAV
jgi:hypothetical protein